TSSFLPFFLLTAPPPTVIYTLSLHDALPIYLFGMVGVQRAHRLDDLREAARRAGEISRDLAEHEARSVREHGLYFEHVVDHDPRSEEHTSELQSPYDLVCRLLLEKKKKNNNT